MARAGFRATGVKRLDGALGIEQLRDRLRPAMQSTKRRSSIS